MSDDRPTKSAKTDGKADAHGGTEKKEELKYSALAPSLVSPDADATMKWCIEVMEMKQIGEIYRKDGQIMHVVLESPSSEETGHKCGGGQLYIGDSRCNPGHTCNPGNQICLHINVVDADALWAKALKAGATSVVDIADVFWGARYGEFKDPQGFIWAVCADLKKEGEAK